MPMLPEVVEMLGGKAFDIQIELMVSGFVVLGCIIALVYVQIFLDDNLKPKREPFEFVPRLFWSKSADEVEKKDWVVEDQINCDLNRACSYQSTSKVLEISKEVVIVNDKIKFEMAAWVLT